MKNPTDKTGTDTNERDKLAVQLVFAAFFFSSAGFCLLLAGHVHLMGLRPLVYAAGFLALLSTVAGGGMGFLSWRQIRQRKAKTIITAVAAAFLLGPAGLNAAEVKDNASSIPAPFASIPAPFVSVPASACIAADVSIVLGGSSASPPLSGMLGSSAASPVPQSIGSVWCILQAIGAGFASLACIAAVGGLIVLAPTGLGLVFGILAVIAACGAAALAVIAAVYTCTGWLCIPTSTNFPYISCYD